MQKEYLYCKRRIVAERLCYAGRTCRSWPLRQGAMGDLPQLKEDVEQNITTCQREVDSEVHEERNGCPCENP